MSGLYWPACSSSKYCCASLTRSGFVSRSKTVVTYTCAQLVVPLWAIGVAIANACHQVWLGPPPGTLAGYLIVIVGMVQEMSPMSSEPPPVLNCAAIGAETPDTSVRRPSGSLP